MATKESLEKGEKIANMGRQGQSDSTPEKVGGT